MTKHKNTNESCDVKRNNSNCYSNKSNNSNTNNMYGNTQPLQHQQLVQ
jgi:hypothetical protein